MKLQPSVEPSDNAFSVSDAESPKSAEIAAPLPVRRRREVKEHVERVREEASEETRMSGLERIVF